MSQPEPSDVSELLKNLSPEQRYAANQIVELIVQSPAFHDTIRDTLSESDVLDNVVRRALGDFMSRFGFSEEVAGMVRLLTARSGDTNENVLLKALTLYGIALDAIEKGNRLAILSPDDDIVREITGFEPSDTATQPLAP